MAVYFCDEQINTLSNEKTNFYIVILYHAFDAGMLCNYKTNRRRAWTPR